ncbi:MAG: amidohydrolase family protein [Anaerolineae bacterium]|jgi:predicted TIM-barrel fold metal-dependent hydrolase
MLDLTSAPSYCAHEHWGSLASIGMLHGWFRGDMQAGAEPSRRTGLLDVLLDPYLGGHMGAAGDAPDQLARERHGVGIHELAAVGLAAALQLARPSLQRQRFTGTYACIIRGCQMLHGTALDLQRPQSWQALDAHIAAAYADLHTWHPRAMAMAGFTDVIRPVQPEFYWDRAPAAERERRYLRTVLRIDPLLGFWQESCPRRARLVDWVGIDPVDAASWRAFLGALFDAAAAGGALGIKQLQAYTRDLAFAPRSDAEVRFRGDLSPDQARAFQDWIVHACCALAHERGWPQQIHVGTANLNGSSPLPLEALARRYPRMRLVLLHCWPFLDEAAWLAKYQPNVYLDGCWLPILSPAHLERALNTWLTYVPSHKLMVSHDATSIEMAAGAAATLRQLLAVALEQVQAWTGASAEEGEALAAAVLYDNAVQLYGSHSSAK